MLDVSSKNLLRSVLHTLAYADVFDYPLTAHEVYRYLPSTNASFEEVTQLLANTAFFSNIDHYYTLRGREQTVEIRERRAQIGKQLWPKAAGYGRLIATLPFVRMVAVTGSLAMNNVDESKDVDIDYMIVTMPNHLWTCRALALLLARFAKLEGVKLCPNYLVTTNALQLDEHSLYTAHELAQMIPLSGMKIYDEIRRQNGWIVDYLPNASTLPEMPPSVKPAQQRSGIQKVLEILLQPLFGIWFEKWERDRKLARLTRQQSSSFESYFSADVCKGHINRHRQRTENAVQERLEQIILQSSV